MYTWRKITFLALALALCLSLAIPAGAEGDSPAESSNQGKQTYSRWSSPVASYLFENETGGLTRVEYINGQVVAEDYDSSFVFQSGRTLPMELPIWGGFFAGEEYNFLIFGQTNPNEDNSTEVIRVVKYSKDWDRLGQASLKGANTTVPFDAGSLRCDEYGGYLYIRTAHEMYKTSDGINHQANLTMAVQQSDMSITDSYYEIMNSDYGYISHSFNQFLLVDEEGRIVTLDHGDAYPRSVAFSRYYANASTGKFTGGIYSSWCSARDLLVFAGSIGANATGGSVGGLAETSDCYIAAYNYDGQGGSGQRSPYFHVIDKTTGQDRMVQKIDQPGSSTPMLAPTGLDGGYMLWTNDDTLYYMPYAANGTPGPVQSAEASLSDCQPICYNGKAVWYVTSRSVPTFYTLDENGVTAHAARTEQTEQPSRPSESEAAPAPAAGTAYASTQAIAVDGRAVTFEAYALKDANGNDTNYVKLRDVAYVLNGTSAQFQVGWDQAASTIALTTGAAYSSNGTEMSTPYSGDRAYEAASSTVTVNGQTAALNAILLKDDSGNGYTYFKLRDLGEALGFTVDWSAERGIYIET